MVLRQQAGKEWRERFGEITPDTELHISQEFDLPQRSSL